jgi:hypothetical protein
VSRVVDNEQILGSIVVANEAADVVIELELGFCADMQGDDVGVVVEAVLEEGLELLGLVLVRWGFAKRVRGLQHTSPPVLSSSSSSAHLMIKTATFWYPSGRSMFLATASVHHSCISAVFAL